MTNLSGIYRFLDIIDANGKIDRKDATNDILLITVIASFKKASTFLKADDMARVNGLLSNPDKNSLDNVYKLFESAGKLDQLLEVTEQVADEIKLDYIKTQYNSLNKDNREKVIGKFPELKQLGDQLFTI